MAESLYQQKEQIQEINWKEVEAILQENDALRKELKIRDENKPLHIAVVAEDYNQTKYRNTLIPPATKNTDKMLPQIKVIDPSGGEVIVPVHNKINPTYLKKGNTVYVNGDSLVIGANGFYEGGEVLSFERILEDGRIVLKSESSNTSILCWPSQSLDTTALKKGDGIRHLGSVALENVGQSLNLDDLTMIPEYKPYSDIIGDRWKEIFNIYSRKIQLLYNRIKNNTQTGRKYLSIALWGLNGNGKTSGAQCMIWDAAQRFGISDKKSIIVVKAGEILSKWVGQTQNNIANIFKKLREISAEHGFAILMIDEFDALCHGGGGDTESSWIETSIVPQWKAELQGMIPLENVLIIVTLNDKRNVEAAILRRFTDMEVIAQPECVPPLMHHIFRKEWADQKLNTDRISKPLMHFLKSQSLGKLHFANKHFREFYPADIMCYADIENICIESIEIAEFEERQPTEKDILACAQKLYTEKAKRIRVGVENGVRRSNARNYFNLSDEEFNHLDSVILSENQSHSGHLTADDMEDL
ncbi:AAA family ATPase [bacterium]|nr:AAA family ATPase [bacterium]